MFFCYLFKIGWVLHLQLEVGCVRLVSGQEEFCPRRESGDWGNRHATLHTSPSLCVLC
jgi:hypothetical protein